MTAESLPSRYVLLQRGRTLEYATVGYNVLEGVIAIGSGVLASSIALVGFGIDSGIEVLSGLILLWRLNTRRDEEECERVGIALAAVSVVVMPLLVRAKRRVAAQLNSRALAADSKQTELCTWLSAILLGGLGLNALAGWWWADPVAGADHGADYCE